MELSFRRMMVALAAAAFFAGCGGGGETPTDAGLDAGVIDAGTDAGYVCPAAMDADGDGVCDELDKCPGSDDKLDSDGDSVPDGCDRCPGHDDLQDKDGDGIGDACDICPAGDDKLDTDGDHVPDACDVCPNDAMDDSDGDGVCDSADACAGFDDRVDTDHDGFPDGCDLCPNSAGNVDSDGDGVCDGADQCPGAPDGWGKSGQDLDNDLIDDGCDLCSGDNSLGDSDLDGACNIKGSEDTCPGVDDFLPVCLDMCPGADDYSPACPDLPWRGGAGGNLPDKYFCPAGSWAVGIQTRDYSTDDSMGAELICKDANGPTTLVGEYGSHGSGAPYQLRCDSTYPDGRMVGQIVAIHKGTNPQDIYLGRPGAFCSSVTAAKSWRIEPVHPSQTDRIYTDLCTGEHEVVTGIFLKTGWWCDGMQVTCSTVP